MHRSTGDSPTLTQKCVKTNRLIGLHTQTLSWKSRTTSECDPAAHARPPPPPAPPPPPPPPLSVVDYRKGPGAGWLAGFTICRLWPTSLSPANPFVPVISEYLTTSNPLCCFISALDFISSARLPGDTLHSPHQLVWDVHWISDEGRLWSDHLKCFVLFFSIWTNNLPVLIPGNVCKIILKRLSQHSPKSMKKLLLNHSE